MRAGVFLARKILGGISVIIIPIDKYNKAPYNINKHIKIMRE